MTREPLIPQGTGRSRNFTIGFEEGKECFTAWAEGTDGIYRRAAMSASLQGLLTQCREKGLEHFEGVDDSAIDRIYQWLTVERPVLEYIYAHWAEGSNPSEYGPKERPFGFPTSQE